MESIEDQIQQDTPSVVSEELYRMAAGFGRRQEQREIAASISGEEGLLHYLVYQKDGVTSGFLRNKLEVGSGRMADILRRLEEKELVVRSADPDDCRRVIVHVTEQGREQAIRTNERMVAWYGKLQAFLGEEDTRELIRILKRLEEFHP